QIAATTIGKDTELPSLELGLDLLENVGMCENGYSCVYLNAISWKTPTTPLFPEPNPRVVFERLFGGGGTADERSRRLKEQRSILDSVTQSVTRLQQSLGPGDRLRVDEYLDAVRDIERRIQRAENQNIASSEAVPDRPVGIPDQWEDHAK